MDDIVKQALAKWPNVPNCYGWLALDARGHWRMRDERAQHLDLPGDKLTNAALVGFINRNYAADERGCWYFQNGPQRVYVELAATPFIVRTDPVAGWLLHTGATMPAIDSVVLTDTGAVILQGDGVVAQLDDRDVAQVLAQLEMHGAPVDDDALLAWLEQPAMPLMLVDGARRLAVGYAAAEAVGRRFGFVSVPTAPG